MSKSCADSTFAEVTEPELLPPDPVSAPIPAALTHTATSILYLSSDRIILCVASRQDCQIFFFSVVLHKKTASSQNNCSKAVFAFSPVTFLPSKSRAYAFFFRYKTRQQAASTADPVMAPIQRLIGVSSPVFGLSFADVPPDVDVSLPDWWLPEPEGSLPAVSEFFSVNTTLTSVPSSFTGSAW